MLAVCSAMFNCTTLRHGTHYDIAACIHTVLQAVYVAMLDTPQQEEYVLNQRTKDMELFLGR